MYSFMQARSIFHDISNIVLYGVLCRLGEKNFHQSHKSLLIIAVNTQGSVIGDEYYMKIIKSSTCMQNTEAEDFDNFFLSIASSLVDLLGFFSRTSILWAGQTIYWWSNR